MYFDITVLSAGLGALDKGVITVTLIDNSCPKEKYKYLKLKENLKNILIDRIEEKFPDIKKYIVN